ncbi:MAG TPA: anti-phage dCTP deaminase [Xanthobacteraceae bacterium]|nr:anti-phage dCTP deaminase [Xanthobacteraceae bacterium]
MTVSRIPYPELIFGLVGPVGVNLDMISEVLSSELHQQSYSASLIRVTSIMRDVPSTIEIIPEPYVESIISRIKYADDICEQLKRQDALAAITISAIRAERDSRNRERARLENREIVDKEAEAPLSAHAFIVRQFKRPGEIQLMRQVYGKLFFQISAYSSPDEREALLRNKIKESHFGAIEESTARSQAIELIAVDYSESGHQYGQKIRETFPLADVFVDGVNRKNCEIMIRRFVNLIFGDNSITPDHNEYGMYLAKSAALRSGDLSRQVGAAIFRATGEVISLGCNEVPKYPGGTYWCNDSTDGRDFALGGDQNEKIKKEILYELIEILFRRRGFAQELEKLGAPRKIMAALLKDEKDGVRDSKLMDILEFGRVIHAEMSAIADAARLGLPTLGSTLYCTTFPCHICAKHIVAAGLDQVVFLEPYPKSYAKELHSDSIEVEGSEVVTKVKFVPFMGISPFRYRDFFEKGRRKDKDGNVIRWQVAVGTPIVEIYHPAYIVLETIVASKLKGDLAAVFEKHRKSA